jgi:hypothetical protein
MIRGLRLLFSCEELPQAAGSNKTYMWATIIIGIIALFFFIFIFFENFGLIFFFFSIGSFLFFPDFYSR